MARVRSARDLGVVVRSERQAANLTQADLAERAGVTREWLVKFEKGAPGAQLGKALSVLNALHSKVTVESGKPQSTTALGVLDNSAADAIANLVEPAELFDRRR